MKKASGHGGREAFGDARATRRQSFEDVSFGRVVSAGRCGAREALAPAFDGAAGRPPP